MSKFSFRRKMERIVDGVPPPMPVKAKAMSLGVGTLSSDGAMLVYFVPNLSKSDGESTAATQTTTSTILAAGTETENDCTGTSTKKVPVTISEKILETTEKIIENIEQLPKIIHERLRTPAASFIRLSSTFLRVADLQMNMRFLDGVPEADHCPNFHTPSQDPPPGVDRDPHEEWVALDDGAGAAAPIAPYAVAALASFGYKTAMNQNMWKAEGKTDRLMKNSDWQRIVWQTSGSIDLPDDLPQLDEVMVWTGNFMHGLYGSDLPAIRSAGIVGMSPKALVDLLVDSSRVKEYNSMSLGRVDLLVLQNNLDEAEAEGGIFGKSITKVMRADTQPPIIRKNLQFVSIMHATALENGDGYLLVSRAVTHPSDVGAASFDVLRSEILMGVNVIRKIEGHDDKCFMVNVNHIRTPMVPLFLGKRLGLAAAPGFIRDLRTIAKSST